jgi:hypothetical protein
MTTSTKETNMTKGYQVFTLSHPHSQTAIYAAAHRYKWGRQAALEYVLKRGCPIGLYRLASQLQSGLA